MPLHWKTPLIPSPILSERSGVEIFLKLDNLQPSGSFKNRGIGHICEKLASQGNTRFVSASGGNAGLALAYSCRKLGVQAIVVVPQVTPALMLEKIKREGAEVIVHGESWDVANHFSLKLSETEKCPYISPFDHPLIWEGTETLVDEVVEDGIKPDAIIVAVGGGGLLSGVVQGLRRVGWGDVKVIAAETKGSASLAASMTRGHLVALERVDTIATSLCAKQVAKQAFVWSKKHPVISEVVTDRQALNACLFFAKEHRFLVEPACGAALAILYDRLPSLKDVRSAVVVVCGGCGVTCDMLKNWDETVPKL